MFAMLVEINIKEGKEQEFLEVLSATMWERAKNPATYDLTYYVIPTLEHVSMLMKCMLMNRRLKPIGKLRIITVVLPSWKRL